MPTDPIPSPTADRELVLSRTFNAPRERVWAAYTDAEQLPHWWGPRGFTNTTHEIDIRVGGRWRFTMHGPDGTDYPNRIVYTQMERPALLAYDHSGDVDDDPFGFKVTVTFEEDGGGTRVTQRMVLASAEQREATVRFGAMELGEQTLDKLAEHLAKRG
jgi:uncharacterized protein YndB with AHSA1/START domain